MPRIAVIDDDRNIRDLLRIHLAGAGLGVDVYEDAAAGIRSILANRPDLVVLDLMLPDLGGLEVLNALKGDASTARMPVVVLTSLKDDSIFTEAKRIGADAFLTKPVSRDELIRTVLGQLARSAARDISSTGG